MALSTEYYNLPGGEMALGVAPLLSQLAARLNGGSITPPAATGTTTGTASGPPWPAQVAKPIGQRVLDTNLGPGSQGGAGNLGTQGQGGVAQIGGDLAQRNVAASPSLASAAEMGLGIATGGVQGPLNMLGGLAASEIMKALGLGDLNLGGIGLGNPFNVAGPELNLGDLQSQIGSAIAALGPNPSQVAVTTAINNVISQARAQALGAGQGYGSFSTQSVAPGITQQPSGQLSLGPLAAPAGAAAQGGNAGNAGGQTSSQANANAGPGGVFGGATGREGDGSGGSSGGGGIGNASGGQGARAGF